MLREECFGIGISISNKKQALQEIARYAKKCPYLSKVDEKDIVAALEDREKIISTGLGNGIAIPHCRLENVENFVIGFITVPDGVDFDAIDGKKVKLIIFIIAPSRETNEHIRILSLLAQALRKPGVVESILQETVPEKIIEKFTANINYENGAERDFSNKNLFHVFIQDENIFREILQVFTGLSSSSVVVIDAQNENVYLSKIPLFAGFWDDKLINFCKIVIAVIDKKMTNEVVRNIDQLTGGLEKSNRVLVAIQNLFYTAGALQF